MLSSKAFAKINLTLDVVGKRPDGYHLLETVMQTVSLFDVVCVEKADGIAVLCSDKKIPFGEKNTCFKAAKIFFAETGVFGGAKITLEKNIPSEAGLGGGSSDAAEVIKLLDRLYNTSLEKAELERLAAKVGADAAFFVGGGTALCEGVGEKITPLPAFSGKPLLLVKPDFGVSTPEAYRLFDEKGGVSNHATPLAAGALSGGASLIKYLSNDLEAAVENPEIEKIKAELLALGAEAALMTGSGSCVYGFFKSEDDTALAAKKLDGKYPFVKPCLTI